MPESMLQNHVNEIYILMFYHQAYSSWMRGLLDFELEEWKSAMENFTKAK